MDLEALVDGLDLAIVRFDEAGRGARINPAGAALLGRDPGAIGGLGWIDAFHADEHPVARAAYHAMRAGGRAELSARMIGAGGRAFDAEALMLCARGAAGVFEGHHLVARDVTRERRQERRIDDLGAQLARQGRDLEELVSIASHELAEPVRKVASFAALLQDGPGARLDDAGRDYLARIARAARRMATLLDDLRKLSRVATATLPFSPVDLREAALAATAGLDEVIRATGARIEIGELPVVEADLSQIEQLLGQLLDNAIRFSKPGQPPVVRVDATVEPEGDGTGEGPVVRLFVSDEGIGFDEAHADRIFRPFQRLHGRGVHEGSGLGLALSSRIVARHNGRIEARGAPGEGATFVVTLPVRQPQAPVASLVR
jgi:signal transduction histidine kinase